MVWDPGIMTMGASRDAIKVNATDVEDLPDGCGMHAAFKVRRRLRAVDWQIRYSDIPPFALGVVRDVAIALHSDDRTSTFAGLRAAMVERLDRHALHPGVRRWAEHSVESYLDAHEELAADTGPLRFLMKDPATGSNSRYVSAWAPMYGDGGGLREIRRLRFGPARSVGPVIGQWAATAAYVAAFTPPCGALTRIRVVEVGLLDGSTSVLFDGTPEAARAAYEANARPAIATFLDATSQIPGRACGGCKIAGCCPAPETVDGHLGQDQPGIRTRSVSASDLETYARCPAQWHMRDSNLPKDVGAHPAAARGRNVHAWLRAAHGRGVKCELSDMPEPGTGTEAFAGLDDAEYAAAYPYLLAHLGECPFGPAVKVIALDQPLYGYDRPADVVVATRPDLFMIDADGVPVLHETKTTEEALPSNEAEAFDRWFHVPWLISLFASGSGARLGATEAGVVELEVLTPGGGRTYAWRLDDDPVVRMARAEVRARADDWHRDSVWEARPGPQCGWCPVSRWCPSAGRASADAVPSVAMHDEPEMPVDDDPPF